MYKPLLIVFATLVAVNACSNFLITKGASTDGSSMISYAADSHTLYGALYRFPAGAHAPGTMRQIYDWDSGEYLGEIPEANYTYSVVGNTNEYAVSIAETTYGGLEQLAHQTGALVDYGSLIYIGLQRAKTAREAIGVMTSIANEYGYASDGESFSIADPNEVWVMDLIGKGEGEKGAVWVAMRAPDGYITAHANQARIRTFPRNDPDNCLYAEDVVDFARKKGLYPQDARDEDFSFSDTFNPVNFEGARMCEGRVWSFFRKVVDGMDVYTDYVTGRNLTNRMPLFVKPNRKISLNDTMNFMRDHYENTPMDFRFDVGAEGFERPYRWRPINFYLNNKTYFHERSVGTQQTGFTFVSQMRSWLPAPIGGILWFGVDDTATTVFAPMYCGMTDIPASYADASGDMVTFSFNSVFWVFNMVSNWAYSRYSLMYPDIFQTIVNLENNYFNQTSQLEETVVPMFKTNPVQARQMITDFSIATGDELTQFWLKYWQYLFVKYSDGNVKFPNKKNPKLPPEIQQPGYPDAYYKRIVAETGDHYLEPTASAEFFGVESETKGNVRRIGKMKGV